MRAVWKRILSMILAVVVTVTGITWGDAPVMAETVNEEPYVVSQGRPVYASTAKNNSAAFVVDGDESTRWESEWEAGVEEQTEWLYVDLGKKTKITGVRINWEAACAKEYRILFSDDEVEWTEQYHTTTGTVGERNIAVEGNARYVRLLCEKKAEIAYGYSVFEFQVLGLDGLTPRPVDYGENLAYHQPVTVSSVQKEWWMIKKDESGNEIKDENGDPIYDQKDVLPENAVDGDEGNGCWHSSGADASKRKDDQWLYVDLGQKREIGRITVDWKDAARAYQIQVSDDATNWTTIYAKMNADASDIDIPIYANGRYVRVYCIASWAFNGFGIKEIQVFAYREGEEKCTYEIEEIPETVTEEVPDSSASYATDDVRFPMAKPPLYLEEELQMPAKPVASNDWWQSVMIKELGDGLVSMPFRTKHSKNGLDVIEVNDCWYDAADQRMGAIGSAVVNTQTDFSITPEGMSGATLYDKVKDYSDYSVVTQLCDDSGVLMTTTITKGSPYLFSEFGAKQDIVIYSANLTGIFDDNGKELLQEENKPFVTDHIGLEITDADNKEKTKTAKSYFCINFPQNTSISRAGNKLKIHFETANAYLSVGAMTKRSDLDVFYRHGYAFVRDTSVTYRYDEDTSKVTTYFEAATQLMREGFSSETMQCLLPHQWKKSDAEVSESITYVSQRGTLKAMIGNRFETVDTFYGMVPQFTLPQNEEYDNEILTGYLAQIEKDTNNLDTLVGGDAYWQGKSLHPLATAVLVADQSGNTEYKELFLERMRYIFEDWFTYSGPDDEAYFFYDKNWGTLYYRYSEFGANTGICDHHFTYGYFLFAAAVLATYDDGFYEEYKDMLDLIIRDYASPYEDDDMFCRFRSFDLYEGHSWAGGYADNDSGNNQEAGGESLFGWVGMYLWAMRSGNKDFRDAAIFGFTTELNDVKQYWFNYDEDNWPKDYPHHIVGQNYGASIFYGTFFDGNAVSVYGIHWLPVAEWITYYGMEQDSLKSMYEGLEEEIESQKVIEVENGGSVDNVKTTLSNWQHIFVPLRSQYDPDGALEDYWKAKEEGYVHSTTEEFNTYWFANNMKELGIRTYDIYPVGGASASVYESRNGGNGEKTYTAIAWNPTDTETTIRFTDGTKIVGSATIGAKSLVRFDPLEKDLIQTATPEFSVTSDVYEDTQYVKILTDTKDAVIYYTTDGSNPTKASSIYSSRIPVSSTTTIKAFAAKDGYIDSAMQSVTVEIAGSSITTGRNLAAGKQATASSGQDSAAYIVDQKANTRWESDKTDAEWCQIDLGDIYTVNKVKLSWEAAYASKYKIQVSTDNSNWQDVFVQESGKGGIEEAVFQATEARYVRMQGVKRATEYGYSIYEMGVYEARKISAPQFSLAEGTYAGNQLLAIASGTKGVEIRYTIDGSEPDENALLYIPRLTVWQDTVTIRAKAFKKGMLPSDTADVTYHITGGSQPDEQDTYDENDSFKASPQDPEVEEEPLAGETAPVEDVRLKNCLSYQKEVSVSSSENENTKQNITDGNTDTVWSSAWQKPGSTEAMEDADRFAQWCTIDLGETAAFNEVKIQWITINNAYELQVSDDNENWKTVYISRKQTSEDKTDICRFDTVNARYVKLNGISVGQAYGYSLAEMMVYLSDEEQPLGADVAENADMQVTTDGNDLLVELDLYKTYQVDKLALITESADIDSITMTVNSQSDVWENVLDEEAVAEDGIYRFEAVNARYVKIRVQGAGADAGIKELKLYTSGSADVAEDQIEYYTAVGAGAVSEQTTHPVANILADGRDGYWQSETKTGTEWCYIDLGESREVNIVSIDWEASCAAEYDIYLTDDITDWDSNTTAEKAYEGAAADKAGIVETVLTNPGMARYVVMQARTGSENAMQYGLAMYTMKAGYRTPIPVERVEAGPKTLALNIGQSKTAECIVSPSNADNTMVTWSSDNEDVAVVNANGEIRAKAAGMAAVTVRSAADETKSATIRVVVTGPLKVTRPKAKKTADNEITVTWDAVEHAKGYFVYRATSQKGNYKKVNENILTETTYVDSSLKTGRYFYKIEAIADEQESIYQDSGLSSASTGVSVTAVKEPDTPSGGDKEPDTPSGGDKEPDKPQEDTVTKTYTVTFNTAGGSAVAAQTVKEGALVNKPADPTRAGYTFAGWYVGNTAYNFAAPVKGNLTLTAKWTQIKVTKIRLTGISKQIAAGKKIRLKATVTPATAANRAVTWKTSNKKYATVNSKGVVTMKKAGAGKTVTITATAKDGSGKKAVYRIKIMKKAVKKITLKAKTTKVKAGKKVSIKAAVTPNKNVNKKLTYQSSNKKYATVNAKGVVTTKKAGKGKTVKITATATDGSGKKASVKIKIQ